MGGEEVRGEFNKPTITCSIGFQRSVHIFGRELWRSEYMARASVRVRLAFQILIRTLPNVVQLAPSPLAPQSFAECIDSNEGINFFSLCDIIKRFMNAVYTVTSRTVVFCKFESYFCQSILVQLLKSPFCGK